MRKKRNFFGWVLFLMLLFLLLNIFTPLSSKIRNSFFTMTASIQQAMSIRGSSLFSSLEVFQNAQEIEKEIKGLRKENNQLWANLAEFREIEKENEALRKALNIEFQEEESLVFGQVIGRDLEKNRITLQHKGDVKEGDPAINEEGVLIGVVEETYSDFSKIKLITDKESSLEAKVQSEDEPMGVLRGRGRKILLLDLLEKDKEINRGDTVVSLPQENSAIGGIYIGRVLRLSESDVEAFVQAEIWQGIDYRYLKYLFIITE